MLCWHNRYNLGDLNPYLNPVEFYEDATLQNRIFVKLPIYLYDHGGITISTTPFSCPWDSGRLGCIYTTKQVARDEFGSLNDRIKKEVRKSLKAEVKEYNNYLWNTYYCFRIENENGEILDSASAFSGQNIEDVIKSMKKSVEKSFHPLFDKMLERQDEMY